MSLSRWTGRVACALSLAALAAVAPAADQAKSAPSAKSSLSKDDQHRFEQLAQSNLAEVETGKLAQGKAASDEVKKFASQMVADHGKMLDEQRAMASSKGLTMPSVPDKSQQNDMKRMQDQSGQGFDRSYMTQMVKDHETDLKHVREIADKAHDPDLKAAAQKALPVIQHHLEMAKQIASTTQLPEKAEGPKK